MRKSFTLGVLALLLLGLSSASAQAPAAGGPVKRAAAPRVSELSVDEVLVIQHQLQMAGFNPGPINGLGVDRTEEAIRRFQGAQGLQVTGQLDPETRGALHSVSGIGTLDEGSDQ